MNTFMITAVIEGFDLGSAEQSAHLDGLGYAAVVGSTSHVMTVDASINSESPIDAFHHLAADMNTIGVHILRIDPDLVNVSEIALRLDVNRETVRLWARGRRRGGFPPHFSDVGDSQIWRWVEVYEWAASHLLAVDDEERPLPADVVDMLNGDLAHERSGRSVSARDNILA
ncbi:hypothetical protein [Paramicrobacterium fandaimingii]|uniref:hypothetical protein n=1 Tax=Paramicrobacterium fandaimingii TaxID=2708079 RepID=UPI0014246D4B|nr:hypothetical protein [Microbacterium fandaimingii]